MPPGHSLDAGAHSRVAGLAAELGAMRDQPTGIARRLLDGLLECVPAQGPCSVLELSRFMTEGGRFVAPPHHKQSLSPKLQAAWEQQSRLAAMKMERRLFVRKGKAAVGTARLLDLFDTQEWKDSPLSALAKEADLGDMAYLWIRCSDGDLWVVCLRRRSYEPPFSARDFSELEEFGLWFGAIRQRWQLEEQHVLTDHEMKSVKEYVGGMSGHRAKPTSAAEKKDQEKHLDSGKKKLGGMARFELLKQLLDR